MSAMIEACFSAVLYPEFVHPVPEGVRLYTQHSGASFNELKIMIGGGQIDEEVRKYVRADAYGKDGMAAVNLCENWIGA
jgi:hypothetical protein